MRSGEFPSTTMVGAIGKKSIPFGGAKWQQSAVVVGNLGIGKTQWALSHFNEGKGALLVTEIDDLLAYCQSEFDGIVFKKYYTYIFIRFIILSL